MKIIWQIGILLGVCLVGEWISYLLPFPFPASVIAMLLLLGLMVWKILRPEQMEETAGFLTKNMSLLFMPVSVGILESLDIIRQSGLQIVVICIVSTFLTFTATAFTVGWLMKLQEKIGKGDKPND